jgi:dTDP-glucose 4,6-dehydratase
MSMTVLITGGSGFIGSNLVRYVLRNCPDWNLVNLDKLTYAGNPESLSDLQDDPRYTFVRGDIGNHELVAHVLAKHQIELVIHSAAETHVDRSILGPEIFTRTNVAGTATLLEMSRRAGVKRFLMVSTDEVYGSLGPEGRFSETTPLAPSSPYSASKAAADLLVLAYAHTYGFEALVSRCSNNYGPYQFPEKLIPLMILNALENKPLPVYGDGLNVREWLHVQDHCSALVAIATRGVSGEVYNIGSGAEEPNIEVVQRILDILGKPRTLIQYVKDRPGHDRRYAIDSAKLKTTLGWRPAYEFEAGLAATVQWYVENEPWWGRVRTGQYQEYYNKQYGGRLQPRSNL